MSRTARKKGSKVTINGTVYEIKDLISSGGTSLIYEAITEVEGGTANTYIIKEFFPANATRDGDTNRSVICSSEGKEEKDQFEAQKKQCIFECHMGGKAAAICSQVRPLGLAQNGFGVMEKIAADAIPLWKLIEGWGKDPPASKEEDSDIARVRYSLRIIDSILKGLVEVHENPDARILHGDLSLYNVYWSRPSNPEDDKKSEGRGGTAYFIDFGSAIQLDPSGTARNTRNPATLSFAAPERLVSNEILSPATDLYSVSAILFILLVGKKGTVGMHGLKLVTPICVDRLYADDHKTVRKYISRLDISEKTKEELINLLVEGLAENPNSRFQKASDMKLAVNRILSDCAIIEYPLQGIRRTPTSMFIGRETELEKLSGMICRNISPVFICGMGGIGKTELALQTGVELKSKDYSFYLTQYEGSLRNTLLNLRFKNLPNGTQSKLATEKDITNEYNKRLNLLREYDDRTVLIIDGFDFQPAEANDTTIETELSSKEYQDLLGLNLQIVFTTRNAVADKYCIEVTEMTTQELSQLIPSSIYSNAPDIIDDIIKEVDWHTLTVDIIGRALHLSKLTPEHLLHLLREKRYDDPHLANIPKDNKERSILGHLRTVFNCSGFSESIRTILYCISLSNTTNIYESILKESLLSFSPTNNTDLDAEINLLINTGWIRRYCDEDAINYLNMHSLISTVCNDINYMHIKETTPDIYVYCMLLYYYTYHLMDEWTTNQVDTVCDSYYKLFYSEETADDNSPANTDNNQLYDIQMFKYHLSFLLMLFDCDRMLIDAIKHEATTDALEDYQVISDNTQYMLESGMPSITTFFLGHYILVIQYYLHNLAMQNESDNIISLRSLINSLQQIYESWNAKEQNPTEKNLLLYYRLTLAQYSIDYCTPSLSTKSYNEICNQLFDELDECPWDIAQYWWYSRFLTAAKVFRKNKYYPQALSMIKFYFWIVQDFYLEHKISSAEYISELIDITKETATCFKCLNMIPEANHWEELHHMLQTSDHLPQSKEADGLLDNCIKRIKHNKEYMPAIHKLLGEEIDDSDPWKDSSIIVSKEEYQEHLTILANCRKRGDFLAFKAAKEKLALLIVE